MSQINVIHLSFAYEGSFDNIFEDVSFVLDSDWKLGLIGRNGKGKTTLLNLLLGKYEYQGRIQSSTLFEYFPLQFSVEQRNSSIAEFVENLQEGYEIWRIICELEKLNLDAEVLYRPYQTLSQGEQTKVMLAMLFSRENYFLLIDEPTNHLDADSREMVKAYLNTKKGFILVSHDRSLLDACVDHVLVLNRKTIQIEKGNFSSWWENKEKRDLFEESENQKHKKEIGKLKVAAERTAQWADRNEATKIGFDSIKEHDRSIVTRSYIGAKTKKMQSRRKQMEQRIDREISLKEELLKDIEKMKELKIMPLIHHKEMYIRSNEYSFLYRNEGTQKQICKNLTFELQQGERVLLQGKNGCGKSSFVKAILRRAGYLFYGDDIFSSVMESGTLEVASGLSISYINQETSFLCGTLTEYIKNQELEESLLKALLRQLDFEQVQFDKKLEEYSEGQKKKLLIATSLITKAHLYIWDEPFNYIDVFSRMQIEQLISKYQPTMLIIEHDPVFAKNVATRVVNW